MFNRMLFNVFIWHRHSIVPLEEGVMVAVDSKVCTESWGYVAKEKNLESDSPLGSTTFPCRLGQVTEYPGAPNFLMNKIIMLLFAGLLRNNRSKIPGKHWVWHVKIHAATNYCHYLKSHHCYFPIAPFSL